MAKYYSEFPHGIMFHYFHNKGDFPTDQGSLSAEAFEEILGFVGLENIVSPEEWIFKLKNNRLKITDLCITFDDGLKCQYDICLPILEKYGIKCFWFIYSAVFEGKIGKLDVYRYFRTRYFISINDFYNLFFQKVGEKDIKIFDSPIYKEYYNNRKSMFPFYSGNDLKFRFLRDEVVSKEEYENIMDSFIKEKKISENMIAKNLWLTDMHLKILSQKGHLIGLHSYDHPTAISELSYNDPCQFLCKAEIYLSLKTVTEDQNIRFGCMFISK